MLEKMQSLANPLKLSAVPRGRIIYWRTILWEKERAKMSWNQIIYPSSHSQVGQLRLSSSLLGWDTKVPRRLLAKPPLALLANFQLMQVEEPLGNWIGHFHILPSFCWHSRGPPFDF